MTLDEIVSRVPESERVANGIPNADTAARRTRAFAAAEDALADVARPNGFRTSPLGPAWSSDVDVHVSVTPDASRLESLGWISLDPFFASIGYPGAGRWAVALDGEVLGVVDVHVSPPADPVAAVIERCHRRGEVRLREMLELRALAQAGAVLPSKDRALSLAADIEASYGGSDLARWRTGKRRTAPAALVWATPRRVARRLVRSRRPIGIAFCGVDGSGKSTAARLVLRDLERLGIGADLVWTRPGMRIAWLEPLARTAKRLMREDAEPGVLRVAADPDHELRSRKGPLGWTWSMLVTRAFVRDVRRRARSARDVAVYDRHLLDALVTLEFAYRGVDLRSHRAVVRHRMPGAAHTFYLDASPELAASRKPGDAIGEAAVRRQLEIYRHEIGSMPDVVVLDASLPPEELARRALRIVLGAGTRAVTGEASAAHRPR